MMLANRINAGAIKSTSIDINYLLTNLVIRCKFIKDFVIGIRITNWISRISIFLYVNEIKDQSIKQKC